MKVGLVGYGKMGQAIEKILLDRGHSISKIINIDNVNEVNEITPETTDVVIEFTAPESALSNIKAVLSNKVPIVSGSTGWLAHYQEVVDFCKKQDTGFFYASNYSLGVNIFFKLNQQLAKMMEGRGYSSEMLEIHHTQKLDAPSGTAITLAEGLIANNSDKTSWVNEPTDKAKELAIISERVDSVPGTHDVTYSSEVDTIKISHVAHNRQGFAQGAVMAAEYLAGKKGVYSMNDLLNF
ncbi:4-hydroxy-tetrahydrodipicolinate reductase [Reichenbachiella carrageenanivorans]|uniref:4-hydroxy-tetrahydrodipicolinate reductase n=1 Tax=Reichenbachiella carrageenanivorans TaxID=2979869 RepID=A0ABY6D0E5_9BACT|nr:4-hydroxy-tetrahydrodipicolinate reductase [Reichenbachiella carrageenanivorans]UXX78538.1 4-hydroxy-tetrahydrodipicolinate reductase [Reichenbachiella carrageenanivorans]